MEKSSKDTDTDILMEDVGEGLGYIQEFVSQEVESIKLEVAEKISIASSSVITGLILATLGSLVFIFVCIALGFFLGARLGSNAAGFLIVSGIFALLLLVVFLFRKVLITDKVVIAVIELFFDQDKDETYS